MVLPLCLILINELRILACIPNLIVKFIIYFFVKVVNWNKNSLL